MSWTQALTISAELMFIGFAMMGAAVLFAVIYNAGRLLWQRWRVTRRWAKLDRISLEALARMERKP